MRISGVFEAIFKILNRSFDLHSPLVTAAGSLVFSSALEKINLFLQNTIAKVHFSRYGLFICMR